MMDMDMLCFRLVRDTLHALKEANCHERKTYVSPLCSCMSYSFSEMILLDEEPMNAF